MLTHFFWELDRSNFYFIVFLRNSVREMIGALYRVSLWVCRRLRWKNSVTTVALSFYAFRMETSSLIWYSLRQTLYVYERTVIHTIRFRSREIQRVSRWYALYKVVPVRFASLWRRRFHPRRVSKLLSKKKKNIFCNYQLESCLTEICIRYVRFNRRHQDIGTQMTIRS